MTKRKQYQFMIFSGTQEGYDTELLDLQLAGWELAGTVEIYRETCLRVPLKREVEIEKNKERFNLYYEVDK